MQRLGVDPPEPTRPNGSPTFVTLRLSTLPPVWADPPQALKYEKVAPGVAK